MTSSPALSEDDDIKPFETISNFLPKDENGATVAGTSRTSELLAKLAELEATRKTLRRKGCVKASISPNDTVADSDCTSPLPFETLSALLPRDGTLSGTSEELLAKIAELESTRKVKRAKSGAGTVKASSATCDGEDVSPVPFDIAELLQRDDAGRSVGNATTNHLLAQVLAQLTAKDDDVPSRPSSHASSAEALDELLLTKVREDEPKCPAAPSAAAPLSPSMSIEAPDPLASTQERRI